MHLDLIDHLPLPAVWSRGLAPQRMQALPPGAIAPQGWLRHQLDLMLDGMVGHLEELSPHLKPDNGWFVDGNEGWEEPPYWLRGFYPLAVLTGDQRCLAIAHRWIAAVLASRKPDGWFGSSYHRRRTAGDGRAICDLWGHMLMLHPLRLHYELTHDPQVIELMRGFFAWCAALPDAEFIHQVGGASWQEYREDFGDWKIGVQMKRAGDMLTHLHWLHDRTGDAALLALAARFRNSILPPVSEFLDTHVVNWSQRFAYPALFGRQADLEQGLAESEFWYAQHLAVWGQQPRGIFGADEMIRSGKTDPRQGMETCAMIELALKFHDLGRLSGDPRWADRCEDVMLNHFPAAQTPDLKGLHYLTASNLPQLDAGGGHDFWNEEMARRRGESNPMLPYSPHRYRCCQHNVAMGWPYHALNLWQASADGGLVAWLYGASEVRANVAGGPVRLTQETAYPFAGRIAIAVAEGGGEFPLYLRVPGWCRELTVTVAGESQRLLPANRGFVRIARTWETGDRIELDLAMAVTQTRWPRSGALTIDRGPLSYSVRIDESWKVCGGTLQWPEWEVLPASPWNYGLVPDGNGAVQVAGIEERPLAAQPWTVDAAPIELRVRAQRIPAWTLEEGGSVQELRRSPIASEGEPETIRMIPLGCARLRMSCLPVVGTGPHAQAWKGYQDC